MLEHITAIAFDLDNTLIDRNAAFRGSIWCWLSAQDHLNDRQKAFETIIAADGNGTFDKDEFCEWVVATYANGKQSPEDFWNAMRNGILDRIFPDWTLIEQLNELRSEFKIALVSNGGSDTQRYKLKYSQLKDCFDPQLTLISGEVGFEKPDPAMFKLLSERLETEPENILFVGDQLHADIAGANAANMRTAWIQNEQPLPQKFIAKPDFTFASIHELMPIFQPCTT